MIFHLHTCCRNFANTARAMADHVAAASEAAPSEPGAPLPPVGLVFDEDCQLHAPPERFNGKPAIEHAERPERTEVIWAAVVKAGLDRQCERLAPREATREEALTCHSCEHVDALDALEHEQPATRRLWKALGAGGSGWLSGADMYFNHATAMAARRAAGGVLALTDAVCEGKLRAGFAIVRPPGHHACSGAMCGFCFLNSVAIAARAALTRHPRSVRRVLVLDWDVHHGNGTQDIFDEDERVLFVSLHRFGKGFFPGAGLG